MSKWLCVLLAVLTPALLGAPCRAPNVQLVGPDHIVITQAHIPQEMLHYYSCDLNDEESCGFGPHPVGPGSCISLAPHAAASYPGCVTLDPGFTAVDFNGEPVTKTVTCDLVCGITDVYTCQYCGEGRNSIDCVTRTFEVVADVTPPTINLWPQSPWVTGLGITEETLVSGSTTGVWAHDGCEYGLPIVPDTSEIDKDPDGKLIEPGTHPISFSATDYFGNTATQPVELTLGPSHVLFPGGTSCQDAELLGVDGGGGYLGEWARFCKEPWDPPGTTCSDHSHCTAYCDSGFHYVGPGGGPYGEPWDNSFIARLQTVDPSQPSGFLYTPHSAITDYSLMPGDCLVEYDLPVIEDRLVYSCPTDEEYAECLIAQDPNDCEAQWVWSGRYRSSNTVNPQGPFAGANADICQVNPGRG